MTLALIALTVTPPLDPGAALDVSLVRALLTLPVLVLTAVMLGSR